jgi:hypothetical protein
MMWEKQAHYLVSSSVAVSAIHFRVTNIKRMYQWKKNVYMYKYIVKVIANGLKCKCEDDI